MKLTFDATVYVVDDDADVREGLSWLLRSRRLFSEVFDSAEAFEQQCPDSPDQPCCLLLDMRMSGMSGLALFDRLRQRGCLAWMPVIFLTGHADVATAVDTVKRGAFDFCEKPFSDNALVDRVEQALWQSHEALAQLRRRNEVANKLAELTERERSVLDLVIEGLPNKLIADQLNISVRTVEVHRARVFDKMAVKSAVELVNLIREDSFSV